MTNLKNMIRFGAYILDVVALHAEPKHLLAKQNILLLILQILLSTQIIDFSFENILDR